VDDDEAMRAAVQDLLSSVGIRARSFASAEEFLLSGVQSETACLISDIRMPGMTGLELQAKLIADGRPTPIIFITAYGNARTRTQALEAGAVEFLVKPFDDERLIGTVRAILAS
jgi:FixJ family two-component response regulator